MIHSAAGRLQHSVAGWLWHDVTGSPPCLNFVGWGRGMGRHSSRHRGRRTQKGKSRQGNRHRSQTEWHEQGQAQDRHEEAPSCCKLSSMHLILTPSPVHCNRAPQFILAGVTVTVLLMRGVTSGEGMRRRASCPAPVTKRMGAWDHFFGREGAAHGVLRSRMAAPSQGGGLWCPCL